MAQKVDGAEGRWRRRSMVLIGVAGREVALVHARVPAAALRYIQGDGGSPRCSTIGREMTLV
jgi:hypothetical protein